MLIVMNGGSSDLEEIRVELSSVVETIKFKIEYKQNRAIPYLGILLKKILN